MKRQPALLVDTLESRGAVLLKEEQDFELQGKIDTSLTHHSGSPPRKAQRRPQLLSGWLPGSSFGAFALQSYHRPLGAESGMLHIFRLLLKANLTISLLSQVIRFS